LLSIAQARKDQLELRRLPSAVLLRCAALLRDRAEPAKVVCPAEEVPFLSFSA
jgi:hypothetical protein